MTRVQYIVEAQALWIKNVLSLFARGCLNLIVIGLSRSSAGDCMFSSRVVVCELVKFWFQVDDHIRFGQGYYRSPMQAMVNRLFSLGPQASETPSQPEVASKSYTMTVIPSPAKPLKEKSK